jgi:hypothetical protein
MVTVIGRVRDSAAARVAPGIVALLAGAVLAWKIGGPVEDLDRPLAVAVGAGLANAVGVPSGFAPGSRPT